MKRINYLKLIFITAIVTLCADMYQAQEINDSFSDGEFITNPIWSGDTGNWEITSSTASTGAPLSNTLHLNVPSGSGVQHLSTPCSNWQDQQSWSFFLGRRNRTYSNSNSVEIWLYANEANLESPTVDGYLLHIGESGATDPVRLQRVTNGVGTTILSSAGIQSGLRDIGLDIKVERSSSGEWTLYTSSIPTSNGTGATADLDPLVQATINHGSVTDIVYTPAGTGYVGITAIHSSTSTARDAVEMDQFVLSTSGSNTTVETGSPTYASYSENAGLVTFPVTIANESGSNATTVDVVLVSGNSGRINSYTTQTLTFPAGSSANQNVVITITNNGACDGIENLSFELQNVSGGFAAVIGAQDTYDMDVYDDEQGYKELLADDFELGTLASWNQVGAGHWNASTVSAINGTFAMRHVDAGISGVSSSSHTIDNASLRGLTTNWRFNFDYFANEPTPANNFLFYLSANEIDLTSATVDGYAVGVQPGLLGAPDYITLWRIEDGGLLSAIVTSSIDYGAAYDIIGIEVTRDENGLWELLIDDDGDFDNLVSEGTGTNTDDITFENAGVYFKYTASLSGQLVIDDLLIYQEGCKVTYYSQGSGNIDDAIWDINPVGTGSTIEMSRFKSLIVQAGHTIDINIDADAENLKIQPTGAINANVCSFRVYGNFENNGSFNEGTSSVCLCSDDLQEIGGASTSRFYDLEVDNSGGEVFMIGDLEMVNVFRPTKGDFDTDGYVFKLLSDAARTASIGMFTAESDFFGEVTYQRYIPSAAGQGWVMLGNCLTGATIAHWDAGLVTTGFTGADYSYAEYAFVNILNYDESVVGTSDLGWYGISSTTDVLSHTKGYAVYMHAPEQNVEVTGEIQKWDFSEILDYTDTGAPAEDGWNFVVNRYPSEIDWDALYDLSGGSSTYYVFDTETDSYLSYNATTGLGSASRFLAPNQPFWVQSSSIGESLEYEETIKSFNNVSYERSYESGQTIAIRLVQENRSDLSVLGFYDGASTDFDVTYDARKITESLGGNVLPLRISTFSNEDELMVNIMPELISDVSIPLNITNILGGDAQLVIESLDGMPESSCIFIEDVISEEWIEVQEGDIITFTSEEEYNGQRFIIHFSAPVQVEKEAISCFGENDAAIVATAPGFGPFTYTWYDELDNIINIDENVYGSSEITDLGYGNYTVVVESSNNMCSVVSETIYVNSVQEESIDLYTEADICEQFQPGVVVLTPENITEYSYTVRNENGIVVLNGSSNTELIEELPGGLYEIVINTTCNEFVFDVDLFDPNEIQIDFENEEIYVELLEGGVLVDFDVEISNADYFTWLVDGEEMSTIEDFQYLFIEEGSFVVQLIAEGDYCNKIASVLVNVGGVNNIEVEEESSVSMYQSSGQLIFTFDKNYRSTRIQIVNALGQLVIDHSITAEKGTVLNQDLNRLSEGAYVVRLISDNKMIYSERFIR